jgi:hypothetical protein
MKNLYKQKTGKSIPLFSSTYVRYNSEQQQFIDFAKGTIRDFYLMMKSTAKAENPNVIYQALVDTYWVYPRTSYDTEPWDFYGSTSLDEITYEWFYAIQDQDWNGITGGLKRIYTLNPTAKHYFIYGTSTMTSTANMRKAVQLTMTESYDGVFLYEYARSRSSPFDVSDLVNAGSTSTPTTSPTNSTTPLPTQPTSSTAFEDGFESRSFNSWSGTSRSSGETMTITNYAPCRGTYDARFTTSGDGYRNEYSYASKSIDLQEVYVRGYVSISSLQGLADNGDTLYLMRLSNATLSLAQIGIARKSGGLQWVLDARSGSSSTMQVYSTAPAISSNRWYCLELHWSATKRLVEMFVDGTKILQITTLNTASSGNAKAVGFGIVSATQIQSQLTVYADCFRLSNIYNGLAPR